MVLKIKKRAGGGDLWTWKGWRCYLQGTFLKKAKKKQKFFIGYFWITLMHTHILQPNYYIIFSNGNYLRNYFITKKNFLVRMSGKITWVHYTNSLLNKIKYSLIASIRSDCAMSRCNNVCKKNVSIHTTLLEPNFFGVYYL